MKDNVTARLTRIRILAWVLAALSLLILLVSAYIRLGGAGLGCSPWPDCYGQLLSGTANLQSGAARILHRSVASLTLLLGFVLVAQCLRPQPVQPAARYATVLLSLMIVLTFVGLFSSDPHRVWPGFINILGGAGLVLLSWRTALAAGAGPAQSPPRRPRALLHAGLGLLILTMALGALIGVRYAATACPTLPGCSGISWPAAAGWGALDPFTGIVAAAGLGDEGGVALHLLHRYCALTTLLLLAFGGLRGLGQATTRPSAGLVLVLLLVQFSLGVLTVLSGFSLWMAIAHSVCASLLLAATVQLLTRPAA
jgi:cytochrome c oxidase assembly protein subunit 15